MQKLPLRVLYPGAFPVTGSTTDTTTPTQTILLQPRMHATRCTKWSQIECVEFFNNVNDPPLRQLWKQIRKPFPHSPHAVHCLISESRVHDRYTSRMGFTELDQEAFEVRPLRARTGCLDLALSGRGEDIAEKGSQAD